MSARIAGELGKWPAKHTMASVLKAAGLTVNVGLYSIRVKDCSHFVFQEYGGDLGEPVIDADADSVEQMLTEARMVSDALAASGIRHRFEIYDDRDEIRGYLHYDWPLDQTA